uniref:Uncharacterized protein n=1 Tax=Ciona savignyi TaxID=51511 RepID=H2YCI6_CIOSA
MLRSQPPPLIHASELFHVRSGCGTLTPNDSGDDFYFQRGLPASPKEEDAVESQIHQNGRRAQENQDHPLNLSCKRKRMKMDLENADWRIAGPCCERKEDDSASLFPRSINKETERAVLYYRAQMLASSDLVRAILKRKLDEEIALKALQQRIENKTVPFALKNFMSHQYSYLPYNMFKYASNLSQKEAASPIIYPTVMHPKSMVSLPSPPISPDKSAESTTHNTVQFPNVTSSVCISPPQISKENYESP